MKQLALLTIASVLGCQPAYSEDVVALLSQPLSPGAVALLVGHADDPAVRERWAAALGDSNPELRAAAARVIAVSGAVPLIEGLRQALSIEQDRDAADGEIFALAVLGGKAVDDDLLAAAKRLGRRGTHSVAIALARARGPGAFSALPALRQVGWASPALCDTEGGAPDLVGRCPTNEEAFLLWATRAGTEGLTAAGAMALREGDVGAWNAVLTIARRPEAILDPGVILAALATDGDPIRRATYWHLALVRVHGGKLDTRVATAVAGARAAKQPTEPSTALALELLGRALGQPPIEQTEWIAALAANKDEARYALSLEREPALLAKLLRSELQALSVATRDDPKALGESLKRQRPSSSKSEMPTPVGIVRDFPRGFVAGVLAATGCDPRSAHGLAAASVTYGADGRPRRVSIVSGSRGRPLGTPPACEEAGRVLLTSALGDASRPDSQKTLLVVLEADPLSCLAEDPTPGEEGGPEKHYRVGGHVKPPKKIKSVNPRYPAGAMETRIQGSVVLETTISPTGCVRSVDVVRADPAFIWDSIHAVSQWRYTPSVLNGTAVPVIMTVTLNYGIR